MPKILRLPCDKFGLSGTKGERGVTPTPTPTPPPTEGLSFVYKEVVTPGGSLVSCVSTRTCALHSLRTTSLLIHCQENSVNKNHEVDSVWLVVPQKAVQVRQVLLILHAVNLDCVVLLFMAHGVIVKKCS